MKHGAARVGTTWPVRGQGSDYLMGTSCMVASLRKAQLSGKPLYKETQNADYVQRRTLPSQLYIYTETAKALTPRQFGTEARTTLPCPGATRLPEISPKKMSEAQAPRDGLCQRAAVPACMRQDNTDAWATPTQARRDRRRDSSSRSRSSSSSSSTSETSCCCIGRRGHLLCSLRLILGKERCTGLL